jgi:hypothetical protein
MLLVVYDCCSMHATLFKENGAIPKQNAYGCVRALTKCALVDVTSVRSDSTSTVSCLLHRGVICNAYS